MAAPLGQDQVFTEMLHCVQSCGFGLHLMRGFVASAACCSCIGIPVALPCCFHLPPFFAAVALAFDEQLSDEALPMDPHDRHVDVLATPGGLLLCSERARAHMQQQSRGQAPAAT